MITKEQALDLIGADKEFYIVDKGIEIQNFKHWTSIRITKTRASGEHTIQVCYFIKAEGGDRYINLDLISLSTDEAVKDFHAQVVK